MMRLAKTSSIRSAPFCVGPSWPPSIAPSDDMSTETLPLRVRGSTTPAPFSGIGLLSCGILNDPPIEMRKALPLDVVLTACETSLVEPVSAPQHPVARDDDRDRVAGERAPGGAVGARVAGLGRDLGVRQEAPVRDSSRLGQHLAGKPMDQPAVGAELEASPAPVEVLVELPP